MIALVFVALLALALSGAFVACAVLAARRRAAQASLLWLLAITIEKGLPLEDELESYSDGLTGRERRDVVYLAEILRAGDSLPDALAFIPGIIPRPAVTAAHVGLASGRLAEALRDAAVRHETGWQPHKSPHILFLGTVLYAGGIGLSAMSILFFLMYWIIPKYKKIFEDFEVELPESTQNLIAGSDVLYEWTPAPVLLAMALAGLLVLIGIASVRGWSEYRFDWLGPWLTRFDLPGVLRNLALVTSAGLPVEQGLQTLVREHSRRNIRRRASQALAYCREGEDPWQALRRAGLVRPAEEELLRSAQAGGNVPWVLRELADAIAARYWFRWAATVEVLQPAAVLVLGAIVLVVCVGFFAPLLELIDALS
jgi:general secretion pathway protein F